MAANRNEIFVGAFQDYPEDALDVIDLNKHRFISVEWQGSTEAEVWLKGHAKLADACQYLGGQMESGFAPKFVLDLDTGERIELTAKAVVVPATMGAVIVPLSKAEADQIVESGDMSDSVARRIDRLRNSQ
jgi:hypothetical protein